MFVRLFIRWHRWFCASLVMIGLTLPWACAESSGTTFSADAVKAAYLVNFIRFTEWPDSAFGAADRPFVIGVAGNKDLEDYLWKITDGKLLKDRKVRVVRLNNREDAAGCELIYVETSASIPAVPQAEWLAVVRTKPVLTVANEPGFMNNGGIVNFYTDGKNLRFEISPSAAALAGLRLSSRLLSLARIVPPAAKSHAFP